MSNDNGEPIVKNLKDAHTAYVISTKAGPTPVIKEPEKSPKGDDTNEEIEDNG